MEGERVGGGGKRGKTSYEVALLLSICGCSGSRIWQRLSSKLVKLLGEGHIKNSMKPATREEVVVPMPCKYCSGKIHVTIQGSLEMGRGPISFARFQCIYSQGA